MNQNGVTTRNASLIMKNVAPQTAVTMIRATSAVRRLEGEIRVPSPRPSRLGEAGVKGVKVPLRPAACS